MLPVGVHFFSRKKKMILEREKDRGDFIGQVLQKDLGSSIDNHACKISRDIRGSVQACQFIGKKLILRLITRWRMKINVSSMQPTFICYHYFMSMQAGKSEQHAQRIKCRGICTTSCVSSLQFAIGGFSSICVRNRVHERAHYVI